MGHEVFVSYGSEDKAIADATTAHLERQGIRCWIAPRDVLPGTEWSTSVIEAIEGSRVMVLVLSKHANSSRHVSAEVERAVHRGLTIIPMRIEDVAPAKSMELFLGRQHWLDAYTPPLERHLDYLSSVVQQVPAGPSSRLTIRPAATRSRPGAWALPTFVAILVIAVAAWKKLKPAPSAVATSGPPPMAAVDPSTQQGKSAPATQPQAADPSENRPTSEQSADTTTQNPLKQIDDPPDRPSAPTTCSSAAPAAATPTPSCFPDTNPKWW
jgi:hypothetical protein